MNKSTLAVLVMGGVCALRPAVGGPTANSNLGRQYAIGSSSLKHWSCGMEGKMGERKLELELGPAADLEFVRGLVFVGYDVLPWATVYGTVGLIDVELDGVEADEADTEYGVGLHFNLLDHELMDPGLIEDRLRVNADVRYASSEAMFMGRTLEWEETTAELTVSIVNDLTGNKLFWPQSVALYAGPAYSALDSDDFEAEETFGFVGGIEIFASKRLTLGLGAEMYDSAAFSSRLSLRF